MRTLLVLLLLAALVGCQKAEVRDTTVIEVIDISDCTDEEDACCAEKCKAFCSSRALRYAKHTVNGEHCPCWCD